MGLVVVNAGCAGSARTVTRGGVEYLVAPLTLIVPGVLPGSKGPLLYPRDEIALNYRAWDGVPLTLNHPTNHLGAHVSATEAGVWDRVGLGTVRNARLCPTTGRLQADGWFDVARVRRIRPDVYAAILANQRVELSTGLYTDNVEAPGTWAGRQYTHVARRYRPDHVAVLPDSVGACSIADGCGVLVNRRVGPSSQETPPMLSWLPEGLTANQTAEVVEAVYNRDWPQAKRDKTPAEDFAGPGQSFPITSQADVEAAAHLVGKAQDPAAVKARIKAIAKRKGLSLPAAWEKETPTGNAWSEAARLAAAKARKGTGGLLAKFGRLVGGGKGRPAPTAQPPAAAPKKAPGKADQAFADRVKHTEAMGKAHVEHQTRENTTGSGGRKSVTTSRLGNGTTVTQTHHKDSTKWEGHQGHTEVKVHDTASGQLLHSHEHGGKPQQLRGGMTHNEGFPGTKTKKPKKAVGAESAEAQRRVEEERAVTGNEMASAAKGSKLCHQATHEAYKEGTAEAHENAAVMHEAMAQHTDLDRDAKAAHAASGKEHRKQAAALELNAGANPIPANPARETDAPTENDHRCECGGTCPECAQVANEEELVELEPVANCGPGKPGPCAKGTKVQVHMPGHKMHGMTGTVHGTNDHGISHVKLEGGEKHENFGASADKAVHAFHSSNLKPHSPTGNEDPTVTTPTKTGAQQPVANKELTRDEWLAMAPPDVREAVATSMMVANERKTQLIAQLITNKTGDDRTKAIAQLETKTIAQLEEILSFVGAAAAPVNNAFAPYKFAEPQGAPIYVGAAGGYAPGYGPTANRQAPVTETDSAEDALLPATINYEQAVRNQAAKKTA